MKKKQKEGSMGTRIAEMRKRRGINSTQLADTIGVTQGQISNYENDKQIPSASVLNDIAIALDSTMEYLLNGEADSEERKVVNIWRQLTEQNRGKMTDYCETLIKGQKFDEIGEIKLVELLKAK